MIILIKGGGGHNWAKVVYVIHMCMLPYHNNVVFLLQCDLPWLGGICTGCSYRVST